MLFKTYCLYFGIGGFLNGVKKQFQTNGWLFDIKMSCITVNCNRSVSISFPSISTVYKNSKSSCKLFMKKKKNPWMFLFFIFLRVHLPSTRHISIPKVRLLFSTRFLQSYLLLRNQFNFINPYITYTSDISITINLCAVLAVSMQSMVRVYLNFKNSSD